VAVPASPETRCHPGGIDRTAPEGMRSVRHDAGAGAACSEKPAGAAPHPPASAATQASPPAQEINAGEAIVFFRSCDEDTRPPGSFHDKGAHPPPARAGKDLPATASLVADETHETDTLAERSPARGARR